MILVAIAALAAVCSAAKLDRTYLPPGGAKAAGGSPGSLQTPFTGNSFNQGLGGLPKGSYTNDFQGVVVDAVNAGTRASGPEETGLGLPRISYGSTASKVGDAAFKGAPSGGAGFRQTTDGNQPGNEQASSSVDGLTSGTQESQGFQRPQLAQAHAQSTPGSQGQHTSERPLASFERASNTLKFDSEVGPESFNYAFETDNGISAEENGVDKNGINAQGGFSYTGDDGQVYSVSYTADENGYQPKGDHLPTPPPIPKEILKSLEQNAREEAAGLVDDGSYDAQKYNAGGDYAESDSVNGQHNDRQSSHTGNRPESDTTASGTFITQSNQPFGKPNLLSGSATGNKLAFNQPSGQNIQGNFGETSEKSDGTVNKLGTTHGPDFNQGGQSTQTFGFKNEYLPPTRGSQISSLPNTHSSSIASSSFKNNNQGSLNFQPFGQTHPTSVASSSAVVSGGRPSLGPQSQHFSGFQQSPFVNGKPNKINQNVNGPLSSNQDHNIQSTGQQDIGSHLNIFSSRPLATAQPASELTTPFETSRHDIATVNSTQSSASAFANFHSSQNNDRPSQSQFGFNGQRQPLDSTTGLSQFGLKTHNGQSPSSTTTSSLNKQSSNLGKQPLFGVQPNNGVNKPGQPASPALVSLGSQASGFQRPTPQLFGSHISAFPKPQAQGSLGQQSQLKTVQSNDAQSNNNVPGYSSSPVRTTIDSQSTPQSTGFKTISSSGITQPSELSTKYSSNNQFNHRPKFSAASTYDNENKGNVLGHTSAPGSTSFGSQQPSTQESQSNYFSNTNKQQGSVFPTRTSSQNQFNQTPQLANKLSQSQQGQFSHDQPQAPTLSQNTQQPQRPDNPYYYNQPSKQFSTPSTVGSRHNTPSNQFDKSNSQPSITNQNNVQFSTSPQHKLPSTQTQNVHTQGSTKYPKPPTLAPVSSTAAPQNKAQFLSPLNGVTQASASSFTSAFPTPSTQFHSQHLSQSGTRPSPFPSQFSSSHSRPSFGQQNQQLNSFQVHVSQTSINQNQPDTENSSRPSQQYSGEVYQYNKPAETLPAPSHKDNSPSNTGSGQFGHKIQPQLSQPSRPQFGLQPSGTVTSSTSHFASLPGSKTTQSTQSKDQFDHTEETEELSPFQIGSVVPDSILFGSQSLETQFGQTQKQNTHGSPEGPKRPPFSQHPSGTFDSSSQASQEVLSQQQHGSKPQTQPQRPCCQNSPSATSQFDVQQQQKSTAFGSTNNNRALNFGQTPNQYSQRMIFPGSSVSSQSVAGKGEVFGGPRKPPSFDSHSGYHY